MLEDLQKSIKATLYDRVTSPLFGSFLLSWFIWNYKFVLVVLSPLSVTDQFIEIDKLYADDYAWLCQGLIFPLASAVFFILVYPYPALWIYSYWHQRQKKLTEVKHRIDAETLLTREQSREIRQKITQLEIELEKQLNEKETEIEELQSQLRSMQSSIELEEEHGQSEKTEINEKDDPASALTEEHIEVLKTIAELGGKSYASEIAAKLGFELIKAEYFLEDMVAKGFMERGSFFRNGEGRKGFVLTTKGKKYSVENKLVN